MGKQRNVRVVAMFFLVISLITLSVAFAMLSKKLNITGQAKLDPIKWGIYFKSDKEDGLLTANPEGKASVNSQPNINSDTPTKIEGLAVTLNEPGDKVSFTVDLVNESDINAIISEITKPLSSYSENVRNVIHFNVNYTEVNSKKEVAAGDIIRANTTVNLTVTIYYSREDITNELLASDEFKNGLELDLSGYMLNFQQSDEIANITTKAPVDKSWKYKVKKLNNNGGLITAYNYAYGTDIEIPAEVDGIPVTTIDANSFLQPSNVEIYQSEEGMYALINETGDNYKIVKNKLVTVLTGECEGDETCLNDMKSMVYFCSSNDSCYNLLEEENGTATEVSIPASISTENGGKMVVSTDLDLPAEESINPQGRKVSTLDLSEASNLTSIGEDSFASSELTSVNFGENSKLKTIGNSAFESNQISSLTLPNSLTTIGNSAFYGNQISSLIFGENSELETIGGGAFESNQISSLTLPNSLTTIGNSAFESNQISGSLVIPNSVITIEVSTFSHNQISSLSLPNSVTTIEYGAFYGNQISGELVIPSSVTTIENYAFYENQISNLTLPKTVTSLGSSSFSNNPIEILSIGKCTTDICRSNSFGTKVKELTIESGEIGVQAFYSTSDSTTKLETLILGEEVTMIGEQAFYGNQISGELVIPNSVTTIGNYAFQSNQISNLTLPKTVTSLGSYAFSNNPIEILSIGKCTTDICSNKSFGTTVKDLTIESGEIGGSAFSSSSDSTTKLETLTLGEEVTSIGEQAFDSNQISSLTLPNSVTAIGSYAFQNNQMSSLTLSSNLITIGNSAFSGNQISGELVIPNSVTTIGNNAFYGNQISGELVIPNSVTTIGNGVFYSNQISNLAFEENSKFETIGVQTFSSNQISGELIIPNSVTTIGTRAFEYNQINSLTLPNSVTTIEDYAFNSNQISSLTFEENSKLETIGSSAFNSNQISSLTLPNSVMTIGAFAFSSNQISSLTFEENSKLETIRFNAFSNNQISSLTLPNSLTTIDAQAFYENQISGELVIPNSVTTIGYNAFIPSDNLSSLVIKRTKEDFEANVTVGVYWYGGNPTIRYEP